MHSLIPGDLVVVKANTSVWTSVTYGCSIIQKLEDFTCLVLDIVTVKRPTSNDVHRYCRVMISEKVFGYILESNCTLKSRYETTKA